MTEENPEPQEQATAVIDTQSEQTDGNSQEREGFSNESSESSEEKSVPLSVLQKERKKRQSLQQELESIRSQPKAKEQQPEEDYSRYESVTKEELGKSQFETIRAVREDDWASTNPEKVAIIESELEDFLQLRPNLAPAIQSSTNRLKEAWELMTALSPKQRAAIKNNVQKDVPRSPGTVPKAAAMNEGVDVMNMNDQEFREWRKSKSRRR